MFNKTFKTLDKYPKIYLGFTIPAIITLISNFLGNYLAVNHYESVPIPVLNIILPVELMSATISLVIIVIAYILLSIFLFPYLLTYIKNASYNISTKESYKEILKKNWYKLLPIFLVLVVVYGAILAFLMSYLSDYSSVIAIILSLIIYNAQIAAIAIIFEDTWVKGIISAFKYGIVLIIPLYIAAFIASIPVAIINFAQQSFLTQPINLYSYLTKQASSHTSALVIINIGAIALYYIAVVFRDSFIYTCLVHIYRECIIEDDEDQEQSCTE